MVYNSMIHVMMKFLNYELMLVLGLLFDPSQIANDVDA